jgi:putative alpha-1,2-mannosidase
MHDYDQMQIMPQLGSLALDTSSEGRRLEYSHDNEIAHPDYYAVTFNNGLKTEITPSSHSAIFRFSFPNTENTGRIIFDSLFQTNAGTTRGNDDFLINNHAISG